MERDRQIPEGAETERTGADTKARLLDVAEELFATQGISNTSLRSITSAADANLASVNYHFGSKDALIKAVFARRIGPINEERMRMLDAIESGRGDQAPGLADVVEAVVAPVMRLKRVDARQQRMFLRLFSQVHSESEEIQHLIFTQFHEVASRFIPLLNSALPDLDRTELLWRVKFMIGAMVGSMLPMTGLTPFRALDGEGSDPESVLRRLIPFIVAGLSVPVPPGEDKAVERGA